VKILRVVLFTLASILDVRVHAATLTLPSQSDVAQEPSSCIQSESVCAVRTKTGRKYEFTIGTTKIILGSASSLIRTGLNSAILLGGEAWVMADDEFELQSEFGSYKFSAGEAWFIRSDKRLTVRSIAGVGQLTPKGDTQLPVPAGFEMWISGVTKKGRAASSIPQAMDFNDHVKRWAKLYSKPKKNFKAEVKSLREVWVAAVETTSEFDAKFVQREVASAYESKIRIEKSEREFKEEQIKLRALYHKKQFE